MEKKVHLITIGCFCAGKTARAKDAAAIMSRPFFDTDKEVENITGLDSGKLPLEIIARFNLEGYEISYKNAMLAKHFMEIEEVAVKKTFAQLKAPSVIATGGSVLYNPELMGFLRDHGVLIHLHVPAKTLLTRFENRQAKFGGFEVMNPNSLSNIDLILERQRLCEQYRDRKVLGEDDFDLTSRGVVQAFNNAFFESLHISRQQPRLFDPALVAG